MPFRQLSFRVAVILGIILIIAAIHAFRLGTYFSGELYLLYYSYASDIMIPFGAYFLLAINEISIPFLQNWKVKAGIVFGIMTFSEVVQYFDIYFFGTTFDPLDILMFAIGVLLAALVDRQFLYRYLTLWHYK